MSTQIKITHTFNAPRELVFKAFTESEHLQNWWGPKGWTLIFFLIDELLRKREYTTYKKKLII